MAFKDRVIEIAYKLKDQFTGKVGTLTGSLKKVEREYEKSASRINRITRRIGSVASAAGKTLAVGVGVGLTALGARLASMSRDIDKLAKDSRKLGIPIEQFQKLGHAAELSGVSQQQLSTGLQRMTRRIAEAAKGAGVAVGALDDLGISIDDIAGKSPDEQFNIIAEAMSKIPDQAERVRIGFKLFDAEGVNLINLMNDGAEGVRKMGDELDKMGGVIDEKTAKSVEDLNDKMTRLSANMDAMVLRFGPDVLDVLNRSLSGLGLAAERGIGNISLELKELYERRRELLEDIEKGPQSRGLWDALFGQSFSQKEIELTLAEKRIRELLEMVRERTKAEGEGVGATADLGTSTEDLGNQSEEAADQIKAEREEQEKLNEALEEGRKKQQAYLEAKGKAEGIRKEFSDLVDEIKKPVGEDEKVGVLDVYDSISAAQQALKRGDAGKSVEILREGAEALRKLKEGGDVADITLQDLARALQFVADKAAGGDDLLNTDETIKGLDEVKRKTEDLAGDDGATFEMTADHDSAIKTAQDAVAFADHILNSEHGPAARFKMVADHQGAIDTARDAVAFADHEVNSDHGRSVTFPVTADAQKAILSAQQAIEAAQRYADSHPIMLSTAGGGFEDVIHREARKRGER